MNIGIDVKSLSKRLTGIGVYVLEMIRYFNELDPIDNFYLFSNKDFDLDFSLKENFHKVIYTVKIGSLGVLFKLSGYIKKYKIDVFWGTEHIIPWKHYCKTIVTIHDLTVLMNPDLGTKKNAIIQKLFTIPSCKKADKIIAISQSTKKDVIRLTGIDEDKVEVIYNGDSPYKEHLHSFTAKEKELIRNKFMLSKTYFLFVGTIEPRKNISVIVKAFDKYMQNGHHRNNQLVLAGGLGWRYQTSLKAIKASPYKSNIIMTGYCSNLEKEYLYRHAIALVFPSLYEGLGLPIIEAMSVGLPVITANNSSLQEIGGNVAYYINDALDYKSLADQMEKVEKLSPGEREAISQSGRDRVNIFSRKKCATQILQLIKSLDK